MSPRSNLETIELIRGQKLSSMIRMDSAYEWISKQDLHDVQRFQVSSNDDFKGKIRISVHLTFETHEKARYWASHNLTDARKADGVFSNIMSYYAKEFPDFLVICHFPIEQNTSKGV